VKGEVFFVGIARNAALLLLRHITSSIQKAFAILACDRKRSPHELANKAEFLKLNLQITYFYWSKIQIKGSF
jgi:hypothetical protein